MDNALRIDDKIFIAGSSGMVGSSILRTLKKQGYGNPKNGGKIIIKTRKELDLEDFIQVKNFMSIEKPNIVILAAAKVGGIFANSSKPADFILLNLKIQTNIIENAWRSGVRRLLFLGSSCIYPKNSEQPILESSLLNSPLESTNEWYAIAKISGLKLCQSLKIQYGFDTISLMPTNLYGQGDNYNPEESHVLPALLHKFYNAKLRNQNYVDCWGSGIPLREFLYVDDLADACIFALKNWFPKTTNSNSSNWINVGSSEEISIKDLAKKIANFLDYKGEIIWDESKPDGTLRKKLDTSKLSSLGWESKTNLDDGIKKTFKFFKEDLKNGELRI